VIQYELVEIIFSFCGFLLPFLSHYYLIKPFFSFSVLINILGNITAVGDNLKAEGLSSKIEDSGRLLWRFENEAHCF